MNKNLFKLIIIGGLLAANGWSSNDIYVTLNADGTFTNHGAYYFDAEWYNDDENWTIAGCARVLKHLWQLPRPTEDAVVHLTVGPGITLGEPDVKGSYTYGVFDANYADQQQRFKWTITIGKGVKCPNSMDYMFYKCSKLVGADLSGYNGSATTTMRHAFSGCKGLTHISPAGSEPNGQLREGYLWYGNNFVNATNHAVELCSMFYGCENLEVADVSTWKTNNVTNVQYMFYECERLSLVNMSQWVGENIENMEETFGSCPKLKEVIIGAEFNPRSCKYKSVLLYTNENNPNEHGEYSITFYSASPKTNGSTEALFGTNFVKGICNAGYNSNLSTSDNVYGIDTAKSTTATSSSATTPYIYFDPEVYTISTSGDQDAPPSDEDDDYDLFSGVFKAVTHEFNGPSLRKHYYLTRTDENIYHYPDDKQILGSADSITLIAAPSASSTTIQMENKCPIPAIIEAWLSNKIPPSINLKPLSIELTGNFILRGYNKFFNAPQTRFIARQADLIFESEDSLPGTEFDIYDSRVRVNGPINLTHPINIMNSGFICDGDLSVKSGGLIHMVSGVDSLYPGGAFDPL